MVLVSGLGLESPELGMCLAGCTSVTVVFARGFWREGEREREIIIDASHDTVPFSVTVGPSPKGGAAPPPLNPPLNGVQNDASARPPNLTSAS